MHQPIFLVACVCLLALWCPITVQSNSVEVLYEWVELDFTWPNATVRQQYIDSQRFIPSNNVITGIKYYKGDTYLTVPRWREGVPATLCRVVTNPTPTPVLKHLLEPWPSWTWNDATNPSAIQYVQSMEISLDGRMWIIDVSRLNIFSSTSSNIHDGTPKLMVFDIATRTLLREFVFPNSVANFHTSFLNDLAIDVPRGIAYISDTSNTGGIIIYNLNTNQARRFDSGPGMQVEVNEITIDGTVYNFATPIDGIALSADSNTLYFCPLSGWNISSIDTTYLRDFSLTNQQLVAHVKLVGSKLSYSDGLAIDEQGTLYYGLLGEHAIASWQTSKPISTQQIIAKHDPVLLQWPDTFAFDGNNNLLATTNKLHRYFTNTLNFSTTEANFRVIRIPIGANSYLAAQTPINVDSSSQQGLGYGTAAIVGAVILLVAFSGGCVSNYFCGRHRQSSTAVNGDYQRHNGGAVGMD